MAANHITKVAIVGIGGHVGSHITKYLLQAGKHTITAITRADSTSKVPDGVKRVAVDYSSHDSLVEALKGHEFLVISLYARAPPDTQSKLIDAAHDAGIKYIMPNEYGYPLNDERLIKDSMLAARAIQNRKHIEEKGLTWIGLACGFWYEFSLSGAEMRFGFDFFKKTLLLFDEGDLKIHVSTWEQCGRAVAKLLSLPIEPEKPGETSISDFKNDSLCIESFRLSQKDMLASILRVTGDKESDWKIIGHEKIHERFANGQKMFQEGNLRGMVIAMYSRVFFPDGSARYDDRLANEKLGLPKEDLDAATKFAIELVETGKYKEWTF